MLWSFLMYTWTASEVYIAISTRTRRGSGKSKDRGTMALMWVTIVGSVTSSEFIRRMQPANLFAASAWPRIAAIALLFFALSLRWAAVLQLGKAFSANVAIRDSQTVYQSGLYRIVRHPSYSALILIFSALALHSKNLLAAAVVFVLPTAALLYRIHVEEIALNEAFGAEYEKYSALTKRLIPGIY
jgi:protein-S-isoprenylcysteine O-methyltransferase Ste14